MIMPWQRRKMALVLRKWMGYGHIGQKHAKGINEFYFECFNEYLNFHRPCAFPFEVKDKKEIQISGLDDPL